MKGIIITAPSAPLTLVDTLDKPVPGSGQILVRSIAAAINPVYVPYSSSVTKPTLIKNKTATH